MLYTLCSERYFNNKLSAYLLLLPALATDGARTLFIFQTRVLYALFLSVFIDILETSSRELSLGPLEKVVCLFLWCLCNTRGSKKGIPQHSLCCRILCY